MDTRIWVCPALCGCKLQLTAEWVSNPVMENGDKVSYQHPVGGSIVDIQVINVCDEDKQYTKEILPDPYGGRPGYMPIPSNPTPGEILYINLYSCHGNTATLGCGCKIYKSFDKQDYYPTEYIEHPLHTERCELHTKDLDHSIALSEAAEKSAIEAPLIEKAQAQELVEEINKAEALING